MPSWLRRFSDAVCAVLFGGERAISRPLRLTWLAALLLCPVAYWAGVTLEARRLSHSPVHADIDRAQAIQNARTYARSLGIDADDWSSQLWVESKGDYYRYLAEHPGPRAAMMASLAPPTTVFVRLDSPDRSENIEIRLGLDGRPRGFERHMPMPKTPADPAPSAETALRMLHESHPMPMPGSMPMPPPRMTAMPGGADAFEWSIAEPDMQDAPLSFEIDVIGHQVLGDVANVTISPAYLNRHSPFGRYRTPLLAAGWTLIILLACFVLVQYVRRTLQKEVSQSRMLLVSLLVSGCFTATLFLSDQLNPSSVQGDAHVAWGVIALFAAVAMAMTGLAAGLAYSGAEGDLREYYPGRLTSLDALIVGRLFSPNVGGALLAGVVLAGWLLFFRNVALTLVPPQGLQTGNLDYLQVILFSRLPWLLVLFQPPTGALLHLLSGLLLPLTVATRLFRRPAYRYVACTAAAWLAFVVFSDEKLFGVPSVLALAFVQAVFVLVAFFASDLLSALVCMAAYGATLAVLTLAQFGSFWMQEERTLMLVGAVTLGAALLAVLRGRWLTDAEVRPLYAQNVAERLSLQDELSAAREAQVRLLPSEPPGLPGLSLAAACRPADLVGGDFYDFYPLGHNRLGLLLTEGGGRGLVTALSIALTKGYLMQKAQAGIPPVELLKLLDATLGSVLDGGLHAGLCYAVVDLNDRTLEYARTGDSPRFFSGRAPEAERIVALPNGDTIREGSIRLQTGQPVILYTDGMARHLGLPQADAWLRKQVAAHPEQTAEQVKEALWQALFHRFARKVIRDDVTMVILCVQGMSAREQVA